VAAIGCTGFVAATNRWLGSATIHPWGHDLAVYAQIARAAPHLPHGFIGSAYTQRFGIHYLVGLVSALGLSLHASYRVVSLVVIVLLVLAARRVVATVAVGAAAGALALSAFLLNPWSTLRDGILEPASLPDTLFVLGLAVALLGLARVRPWVVAAGLVVAVIGRQTALLAALATLPWMAVAPGWRERGRERLGHDSLVVLAPTAIAFGAIVLVVRPFTRTFAPGFPHDTILALLEPSGLHDLVSHSARVAEPLIVPVAVLLTVLALGWRGGVRPRALPFVFRGCLLISAAVVVQPLFISPHFPGFASNEQRLAGLGLLPLCAALGVAIDAAVRAGALRLTRPAVAVAVGAFAVGSLHPSFNDFGPSSTGQFVPTEVAVALIAAAALAWPALRSRLPSPRHAARA
jgi:hypothetical protein